MTIGAYVVTLSAQSGDLGLAALRADNRVEIGEVSGRRVPVVAETADCRRGQELVAELETLEGIDFVDVVMIDFSEEHAP